MSSENAVRLGRMGMKKASPVFARARVRSIFRLDFESAASTIPPLRQRTLFYHKTVVPSSSAAAAASDTNERAKAADFSPSCRDTLFVDQLFVYRYRLRYERGRTPDIRIGKRAPGKLQVFLRRSVPVRLHDDPPVRFQAPETVASLNDEIRLHIAEERERPAVITVRSAGVRDEWSSDPTDP